MLKKSLPIASLLPSFCLFAIAFVLFPFNKVVFPTFKNKYLIILLLLLSGYSQLSAHLYKYKSSSFLIGNTKNSDNASVNIVQSNKTLFIRALWFGSEKQNNTLNVPFFEKVEDDEFSSSKRHLKNSNYSTSIFFVQVLGYSFSYNEKTLPIFNHFSYNLSHRYIVFQVFRV